MLGIPESAPNDMSPRYRGTDRVRRDPLANCTDVRAESWPLGNGDSFR